MSLRVGRQARCETSWRKRVRFFLRFAIFKLVRPTSLSSKFENRWLREEQICAASGLFDANWYLELNPDVAAAGMNPLNHYVRFGAAEGRDPSPLFDSDWYLNQNPDVAASGVNPLVHYVRVGATEGRDPNPFFDSDWYLNQNPDVAASGVNPLIHYVRRGAARGSNPHPFFDGNWYLERYPDVAAAGFNPLIHYIRWGMAERRVANPGLNSDANVEQGLDVVRPGLNSLGRRVHGEAAAERLYGAPDTKGSLSTPLPTISAVVPCYNGARWLADALDSIKAQTLSAYEIIVVDDASTDNSEKIAHEYGALVIRNTKNRGEGYSRNRGLQRASGDLIAWLDADDVWMPHHLSTLTGLLQRYPQATTAFAAVQRFGLRNELIRGYVPPGEPSNVFWLAFRDWVHTTIGSMTRRSALLHIGGFNEEERYSVDFDLWLRLSRSHLFVATHEVTSYWRWHDAQQSSQRDRQVAALYRFRRAYWERECAVGDPAIAAEMERCMVDIWHQEMIEAWEKSDLPQFRSLCELAVLVPRIPAHYRSDWERRVRALDRDHEGCRC